VNILKANKLNLFLSSVLFVFWYNSPKFLDTQHIYIYICKQRIFMISEIVN
jgi:hypothetical protein